MSITRREFALGATSLVALTIVGRPANKASADLLQDQFRVEKLEQARKPRKPPVPKEIYTVGPLEQYLKPGVYGQYNKNRRVWLINDGSTLAAVADVCTHRGCGLNWFTDDQLFKCPCHHSEFKQTGLQLPDGKAHRPLERFPISLVDSPTGKVVQIDPTERLRDDQNKWEDPRAAIKLPTAG